MRLNVIALGGALGVIVGITMMALAWAAWVWSYDTALVQEWSGLYPGYEASLQGGFFGLGWGLLEGATAGVVLAWLYNCLCPCCRQSAVENDTKKVP
jgi:hypothetical protein